MESKCDHTTEIAKEMYKAYETALSHAPRTIDLSKEPEAVKQAWYHVADRALPIIATHAAGDLKEYAKTKFGASSGWSKLAWGAVGAVIAAGTLLLSSCTGVDSLILQGEKGTLNYYVDPVSGNSVLIVSPAKVTSQKK